MRPNRRALGWIGFGVGGILVYTLVLLGRLQYFLQNRRPGRRPSASRVRSVQQTVNALSIGAIYALIALGYTMVYGIIELINFAHGDMFMLGAFGCPSCSSAGSSGQTGAVHEHPPADPVLIAGALVFAMPLIGLLNVTIERLVYRPLRNAPRLAPLITAIGVSFILQNVALVLAGSGDRRAPQIFPLSWQISILRRLDLGAVDLHLRARADPDVAAPGLRRPDAAGPGDAGHRPGPARPRRSWAST